GPPMPRIVVTGIGAVTSVGLGRRDLWDALLAGRSGISDVTSFDTSRHPVHRGGEVHGFVAADHLERLDPGQIGRASQLAAAAARLALADAGLDPEGVDAERGGVVMGTTSGEPMEVERFDDRWVADELDEVGAEFLERYPNQWIAANVAGEIGFAGPVAMIPTACAAGNYAVAHAFDLLRAGRADVVLAGGADSFSRITYTGFARLGAIAPERCQPFDRNRKGMIPGEGAAVLVLETAERAAARGARMWAEVAGYGLTCDAHHMTGAHPQGDGAARAMEKALAFAGLTADDVDYVSAHGTGTPTNDRLEAVAVERVFGRRRRAVPVSSIKSMLGHTMGAASAIEAAACALAVAEDRIPPTINFDEPDPDCRLDCVPNQAREVPVEVAMNNAYAFGGNNASVLFRKVRQ
ncbi:MAG TPA: beta-ketoacyl-[acyl-carrier-protein] synthase family protein, partial [Thermoanaerobaculia bacterium]|nr:beta-ketoacyl-[acyl-carrier-protein] synthase family protein [Thermoanaerobaculia bacterium]